MLRLRNWHSSWVQSYLYTQQATSLSAFTIVCNQRCYSIHWRSQGETWVHVPSSQLEISICLRLSPQTLTGALPLDPGRADPSFAPPQHIPGYAPDSIRRPSYIILMAIKYVKYVDCDQQILEACSIGCRGARFRGSTRFRATMVPLPMSYLYSQVPVDNKIM